MSDFVFQGRVVEAYDVGRNGFSTTGARMEVQHAWKGDLPASVDVNVATGNLAEFTRFFLPGVEYLVYAQGPAPALTVQFCSPMVPASQVRAEMLFLSYGIPMAWAGRLAVVGAALAALCLLLDAMNRFVRRARGLLVA